MNNIDLFMGEKLNFWIELKRHSKSLNADKLLREIAELRSKVSYYEERIDEMSNFKQLINSKKII